VAGCVSASHLQRRRHRRAGSLSCAASPPPQLPDDAPPAEREPLWRVPWDTGVAVSVSGRFLLLWTCFGYLALPLLEQVVGHPLSLGERSTLQLPLELCKGAALAQLLSSSLRPFAPLPPPLLVFAPAELPVAASLAGASLLGLVGLAAGAASPPLQSATAAQLSALLAAPGPPAWSLWASALLVAPPLEETFFRGFLLPSLCAHAQPLTAVALQAALFAALHFNASNTQELVQTFAVGCSLGVLTLKARGNLAAPIAAHAAYNALTLTLLTPHV